MRSLFGAVVIVLLVSSAGGTMVWVDADGFGDGVDISNALAGVTLSSVGGYSGLDGIVYAWGDGLASTGTNVFANNLSFQRQWYAGLANGFALRADFDQPANYVAIDIIGDSPGDYGILNAYSFSGVLLASVTTAELVYGEIETASISRGSYDIAYIIAGGAETTADTVHLDNLMANVIPEPTTMGLLALGALMMARKRK